MPCFNPVTNIKVHGIEILIVKENTEAGELTSMLEFLLLVDFLLLIACWGVMQLDVLLLVTTVPKQQKYQFLIWWPRQLHKLLVLSTCHLLKDAF